MFKHVENSGGSDTYQDWNGKTKGAGKGALIQKDLSATLAASQDQTLFRPSETDVKL